jgi:hypothetical protein
LIFTNVDDGCKVYEKLLVHYLGENGQKIISANPKTAHLGLFCTHYNKKIPKRAVFCLTFDDL